MLIFKLKGVYGGALSELKLSVEAGLEKEEN